MPTVKEVMTSGVLTLAPDAKIEDVAEGLKIKGYGGAPVEDKDGHVLGVISKSDLADPDRMSIHAAGKTAEDLMTPALFAIRDSEPVLEAAKRMVETGSHRLLVVGADDRVVGIITPMDVMRAMVEGRV